MPVEVTEPLENVYEEIENTNTPPEPTLTRRAASYSDFYSIVRAQISKDEALKKKKKKAPKGERQWDALMLCDSALGLSLREEDGLVTLDDALDEQLLEASQEDYLCVLPKCAMQPRHHLILTVHQSIS